MRRRPSCNSCLLLAGWPTQHSATFVLSSERCVDICPGVLQLLIGTLHFQAGQKAVCLAEQIPSPADGILKAMAE